MTTYDLEHVLAGTGGVCRGELPTSTTFGTLERVAREIKPGELFIAVKDERFDRHDFVEDAFVRGAAAAIVSERWATEHPDIKHSLIIVEHPIPAVQRWAGWWRNRLDAKSDAP